MAPREGEGPIPDQPTDCGDGAPPVAAVLAGFSEYLLGDGPVEVADLGGCVADLGQAGCVRVAAAVQRLLARAVFLQDRVCAEAVQDDDVEDRYPLTAMSGRYARSAEVADLATACRLAEGAIWYRVHRARDLATDLPGTQARAATGVLDARRVEAVRDAARDLSPADRHRLDEVVAGRPDPLTPEPGCPAPTQALRPLTAVNLATPRRFEYALRRRTAHLNAQADRAHPTQTSSDQTGTDQTGTDQAGTDQGDTAGADQTGADQTGSGAEATSDSDTSSGDTSDTSSGDSSGSTSSGSDGSGGLSVAGRIAALLSACAEDRRVTVNDGSDGLAYLTVTASAVDIYTLKAALDAAARAGHHRVDTLLTWARHALAGITPAGGGGPVPRPHVLVTVPLATLTGQGSVPADLAGYGPLPTELFNDVWRTATIRCGVVDDTGTLLALGHTTHTQAYTPPERLRRFVVTTWSHCAFPGCDKPAATCQLDHTIAWPAGPTCACNLRPLCALHHNLKTHTGWAYTLYTGTDHPPGTLEWTSPTGAVHHSEPALPEITSWWPPLPAHPTPPPAPFAAEPPPAPPITPPPAAADDDPPPF